MRRNTKKLRSKFSISKYLPVFIILISITIILGSTFAYFTDRVDKESTLTFSKVELSSETTVGINGTLKDVIPGTPLTNGSVSFSKSIDSQALYVRAKVSFSLPSEYKNDTDMQGLLNALRSATDFNVVTTDQHGAIWSAKDGNYFYLMENANGATPTLLKRVDTIDTYTLAEEIIVPRDLKQLDGNAQYMKSINFHIAFEAIQADNVSNQLSVMKETFNTTFPELEDEKILNQVEPEQPEPVVTHSVTVFGKDLTISSTIDAEGNKVIEEPEIEIESNEVVVGWYEDAAFENAFDFNEPITSNVSLYPKVLEATNPSNFDFVNGEITKYKGSETSIVLPRYYKVDNIEEISNSYERFTLLNSEINKIRSGSSTVGWTFPVTITDPEGNQYVINDYTKDYYPIRTTLQAMTGTFTISASNTTYTHGQKGDIEIVGIGSSAFKNSSIREILIPEFIKSIGGSAFYGCSNLVNINIPLSVTALSTSLFYNCTSIQDITISENITSIGGSAFYGCSNLSNIEIPRSVTNIGSSAFQNCTSLVDVFIPNSIQTLELLIFYGCTNLESVVFEDGTTIKEIPQNIFENCSKLSAFKIPNSVEYIGYSAFYNCTSLSTIYMSENVRKISYRVFNNTAYYNNQSNWENNMLFLPIENTNERILIASKTTISGVVNIPNNVRIIVGEAFKDCANITKVIIPDSVIYISYAAFENCTSLTEVQMANSVEGMDGSVFYKCSSLGEVVLSTSLKELGLYIFRDTAYYNNASNWKNGLLFMPVGTEGLKVLVGVNIDNTSGHVDLANVICIAGQLFTSDDITGITLWNGLLYIGRSAMNSVNNLKSLIIPKSVGFIGEQTFYNSSLECIIFEAGIDSKIEGLIFNAASKIKYLLMDEAFVDNFSETLIDFDNLVYILQETGYSGLTETEVVIDDTLTIYTATDSDGNEWVRTADNKYYKKMI